MTRHRSTWLLYAVLACLGFMLNGLGAVLAPLQADLQVSRAQVAFYPSLFAAGLLAVGVVGGALVARAGRPVALQAALAAMLLGGSLLAVPARPITLTGAVLLGAGAALLIQLVPALLAGLHPQAVTSAVGEANAASSVAAMLASLTVAATLAGGLGWRLGYLALPLAALAVLLLGARRTALPAAPDLQPGSPTGDRVAAPILGPWTDVLLAVSVEFCMVFWAPSALADWHQATADQAPAVAALFLVGMAGGRALAAPITRRLPTARAVLVAGSGLAAAGFAGFWAAPTLALAGVGLLLAGLGVALLYPATVSRAVAAWPHAPDRAAARAALASGLAIGGAPYLLAQLADATGGLRPAYLLVPVLLLGLAVHAATGRRPQPTPAVS